MVQRSAVQKVEEHDTTPEKNNLVPYRVRAIDMRFDVNHNLVKWMINDLPSTSSQIYLLDDRPVVFKRQWHWLSLIRVIFLHEGWL